MNIARIILWLVAATLFSAMADRHCSAQSPETPAITLSAEAVRELNEQAVVNRPKDAEAPSRFSADHAAHAAAYNFQAPGIAVVPLPDGRIRMWLSWYQQSNNPGGGAIGGESIPYCVYCYCDDLFGAAEPVWRRAFYLEPMTALGGETASDPEVSLLPDGRLLCSYITSGPDRTRKRSTYAFLVDNPAAMSGESKVGRQQWLEYGVLSQPFVEDDVVYAVIDEWNVARRFCRLEFAAAPRDSVKTVRISDIPWPGHPELTIFFEGSVHVVAGGRFRAYRRTKDGVYTTLSDVGGLAWGKEQKWTDHNSVNSRSAFARSPSSGRIIGAVNSPPAGSVSRTDLTLVVSETDGQPGTFRQSLNIEPDQGLKKIASQYPRVAFDKSGNIYCVYRWSDSRKGAPHQGAAIMVARVPEKLLASGTAKLSDVEKRVAVSVTRDDRQREQGAKE